MPVDLDRLASIAIEKKILRAGSQLYRVYFRDGAYPGAWNLFRAWGPHSECRFDHHEGPDPHVQDREILYAAERPHIALVEVFHSARAIHRTRHNPALAQFVVCNDLTLLDLSDTWIHRAGGSPAEIISGNREIAREWARAIWTVYPVDGIYYRSALALNEFNVALFERAQHGVPAEPVCDLALTHPGIAAIIAATAYDYNLDLL